MPREAFEIAANYKPKLTRYDRQQILFRRRRNCSVDRSEDELSDLITLELGISKKDSHSTRSRRAYRRVYAVRVSSAILDDGRDFFLRPDPPRQVSVKSLHQARALERAISAITPFNHPLNMVAHKIAPSIATNNCMVCKPTELTPMTAHLSLADVLYEGWPAAGDVLQMVTGMACRISVTR